VTTPTTPHSKATFKEQIKKLAVEEKCTEAHAPNHDRVVLKGDGYKNA
jgi:hypothetical protein